MTKTLRCLVVVGCVVAAMGGVVCRAAGPEPTGPYQPSWESLAEVNEAPEWFRDAKIGIYFHWGVYSVPAFGNEWYPRNMHVNKHIKAHHVKTWGEIETFGYADFVPMFKAEKFDADDWAELFIQSGARFAGPVAEHHDGFAMWDSELTPWDAADKGPKRDITGELEKAIRKRGMKFVATFHHARHNLWQKDGKWTGHYSGVKEHHPTLLDDPERALLYGYMPREQFCDMWLGKLKEVIDAYEPDLIWFDSWLHELPESYRQRFAAYYYNRAVEWGREVVVTRKQNDLPMEMSLVDFEKGRADRLTDNVWLTDDTISKGSWCYTTGLKIKEADEVIDTMVDLVSKNGQLLLNISPKADGTIPQDQRDVLLAMGDWLKVNGEAIYNTRPWLDFGEGPTRMKKSGHFVGHIRYGNEDIRYTRSKDGSALYVTLLGWPEGPVTLQKVKSTGAAGKVALLGSGAAVSCDVNELGQPVITLPELAEKDRPSRHAHSLKLSGWELSLNENAIDTMAASIKLEPGKAVVDGERLKIEEKTSGQGNLGFWDIPEESAHWLARVTQPGAYNVIVETASMLPSKLTLEVDDQTLTSDIPATGSWGKTKKVTFGVVTFKKPGVYHVALRPTSAATWKAVNLFGVSLLPAKQPAASH